MLASNRGNGIGWKFFLPPGVIAGFLVFAKRGFTLCLRICSIKGQNKVFLSEDVSVINISRASADFVKLSCMVQGSSMEVKLANAVIISDAFPAFHIGNMVDNEERTDTARDDFRRLSLSSFFLSFAYISNLSGSYRYPLTIRYILCISDVHKFRRRKGDATGPVIEMVGDISITV